MADLDDFFAKKDRKKGKSSKKFATTEEVAKKLEDTAKKVTDVQVKKPKERLPEEGENLEVQEQDEWKDFEEEKKDYSGLKIGNLTIGPNGEQGQTGASNVNETGSGEPSEGGEQNADSEKKAGPWRRMEATDSAPQPSPEPVRQAPAVESPNVKGGVYQPPSFRRGERPTPNQPPASRLRTKGTAPDIHNEEFFPTLSKSGDKKNKNEGSFEVVQSSRASSYRNQQAEQNKMAGGPKLSLGNRYNTLSNDS